MLANYISEVLRRSDEESNGFDLRCSRDAHAHSDDINHDAPSSLVNNLLPGAEKDTIKGSF
jgi:hypothetical protein